MTTKYWIKILLGMLGIFVVGMVAVQGIKAGKSKIEHLANGTGSITLPMFGMPFRLDGAALGSISRVRIERDAPKEVSGVHLIVELKDATPLEMLATCDIAIENPEEIDEHTSFICASDDSGAVAMVDFGSIVFQPSGQRHVLNVPETFRDEVRNLARQHDTGAVQIDSNGGQFRLDLNGKEIIRISGDSAGGWMSVRDPATGKPVVEIKGRP